MPLLRVSHPPAIVCDNDLPLRSYHYPNDPILPNHRQILRFRMNHQAAGEHTSELADCLHPVYRCSCSWKRSEKPLGCLRNEPNITGSPSRVQGALCHLGNWHSLWKTCGKPVENLWRNHSLNCHINRRESNPLRYNGEFSHHLPVLEGLPNPYLPDVDHHTPLDLV